MSNNSNLFKSNVESFGDPHHQHMVMIYTAFLQSMEAVSNRRQSTHSFFLSINTAIVALSSYFTTTKTSLALYMIPATGIVVCLIWDQLLRKYRNLNKVKFKVIHDMEQKLPMAPYDAEGAYFMEDSPKQKDIGFTFIERRIPYIFILFHLVVLVLNILL